MINVNHVEEFPQWYKIFYAASPRDSMYEICTQQIAEYVERAKSRNLIWTK